MADSSELLFFDTFSHENCEELNLDLVQFPKPVYIGEVRIIPLGARVEADFPGGMRLGATNPSQFKIEFFVNDLSKPGASTFESLGALEYRQNGSIHLESERRIPTDGLVLRGLYSTITLAVYGILTKTAQETTPAAPVAPSMQHALPHSITHPSSPLMHNLSHPRVTELNSDWQQQSSDAQNEFHSQYQREWPQQVNDDYRAAEVSASENDKRHWERSKDDRHRERDWDRDPIPEKERKLDRDEWDRRSSDRDRERSMDGDEWDQQRRGWNRREWPHQSEQDNRPHSRESVDRGRERMWEKQRVPPSRSRDGSIEREDHKRPRSPSLQLKVPRTPPAPPADGDKSRSPLISDSDANKDDRPKDIFEPLSPGGMEDISDGEVPEDVMSEPEPEPEVASVAPCSAEKETEPERTFFDRPDLEQILSDEDIDENADDIDDEGGDYWEEFHARSFNPYAWEAQSLMYFSDPSLTLFENKVAQNSKMASGQHISLNADKLLNDIRQFSSPLKADCNEEWVETIEQIPAILQEELALCYKDSDVINTLVRWGLQGIDFNIARQHTLPLFVIRHLKAGLKLITALYSCGSIFLNELLEHNVLGKLLDLYVEEHMAPSIKLMILHAVSASLTANGIIHFVGQSKERDNTKVTFYQRLVSFLMVKGSSRINYAIAGILYQVHLYELLNKFRLHVESVVSSCGGTDDKEMSSSLDLSDTDAEIVIASLEEILHIYNKAQLIMNHAPRFLPVLTQFELPESNPEAVHFVFSQFREQRLLETVVVLLACPVTSCHLGILAAVQDVLQVLMQSQEGLLFLLSQPEVMNNLARALLPNPTSPDEGRGDEEEGSALQSVGVQLVHYLQVVMWLDSLFELSRTGNYEVDDQDAIDILQSMYHMLFTSQGRQALTFVLSRGTNLKALIPFIRCTADEELDAKMKKSVSRRYTVDMVVLMVKQSEYIPCLKAFGDSLLQICRQNDNSRLRELVPFLLPLENPEHFSYKGISSLCEILKQAIDDVANIPGELITSVRLLQYLGIPPDQNDLVDPVPETDFVQLKYKHAIFQLYSYDGLSNFMSVLQKLCTTYDQPMIHTASLVGSQGLQLVSLVLPLVKLVRRMLTYSVRCRNTEFRDLTAVPVLLHTYVLMQAIPISTQAHMQAQEACQEIVATLLAYTQPVLDASDSEDALSKSLWTQMVGETLKFVLQSPYTFIPGLLVLSEILPLPLPIHTKQPLTDTEIHRAVHSRKLWSAHLLNLAPHIQELISTLSGSSFQPLLQLLRRVCVQLADLAAPAALVVCRAILDTLLTSLESDWAVEKPDKTEKELDKSRPCSGHSSRLLNFLCCLVSHPSLKAGLLHLTRGVTKTDEKYVDYLQSLSVILTSVSELPSHVQAQECVVSILQSICDVEVSLGTPENETPEAYLANSLPQRDQLVQICSVMLEHISHMKHNFTTLLPTLRTLVMLTENDYHFYYLKSCLEKRPNTLYSLFTKISNSFSKDSSDCLSTLSTALELLRFLLARDEEDVSSSSPALPPRSLVFTPSELAVVLQWTSPESTDQSGDDNPGKENMAVTHPILTLKKQLQECSNDDEAMESLAEQVSSLVRLLEEEGQKPVEPQDTSEPILPPPEPLTVQFASRPVFAVGEDEERLSVAFWLAPLPVDEADLDGEQVPCDLLEFTRLYLGDWDLKASVGEVCRPRDNLSERAAARWSSKDDDRDRVQDPVRPRDRDRLGKEREKTLVLPHKEIKPKKAFAIRGRGFGRPSAGSRGDPFRSRPPNTSRPPSLHVDDFVKLENAGQQPTGPTGYNKQSMRAVKELFHGRSGNGNRGRGFGTERGNSGVGLPSVTAAWASHSESSSVVNIARTFRTPEPLALRERSVPRSEEKFGSRIGSRGWTRGKDRDRRGSRRDARHARAFTR